jgi:hypothetical protein
MAITFTIGGVDTTPLVRVDSLKVQDRLNGRNTASFDLVSEDGTYRPTIGAEVVITRDGTRLFAGFVNDYEEEDVPGSWDALLFRVPCVDYNAICNQRLVAKAYEAPGQTLGDIVLDIVASFLAGEGITTANVQDGPIIDKAVWNYQYVAEAFNDLADLSGYIWYIDYNKDLHFVSRDTNAAPFALTDTSGNFRKMKVRRTREQYRNKQIIRAGKDLTDPLTETFKGDGETRVWPLKWPVGAVPTSILLDGVPKTFGIGGVDTGKDFYWNKGTAAITQDDSATKLTAANIGTIIYRGEFPIVLAAQDDAQIAERQAVEGGTGIHERVEDFPAVNSTEQAEQGARGLIEKYGRIPRIVTFETDVPGLAAGQLLTIANSLHDLSGSFLIESVSFGDMFGRDLRYTVKALDGSNLGGWEEFFRALTRMGRRFVIRENEVVVSMRTSTQAVTASEVLTYTTTAPENRVGHARVNYSEVG